MANDLNLLYSGGSGGFALLHFLLMSEQFDICFPSALNYQKVFDRQWKISTAELWKIPEVWPDNDLTYQTPFSKNKIYYYCNPEVNFPDLSKAYCNFNLVLYLDYYSQHKLARYKKAWLYLDAPPAGIKKISQLRQFLDSWKNHYSNIKGPGWPDSISIRKLKGLPADIQAEILENPHTEYFLNYRYYDWPLPPNPIVEYFSKYPDSDPVAEFNGVPVFDAILPFLEKADLTVTLQDFINTNGECLVNQLNLNPVNDQQRAFLSHWRSLHAPELLQQIGIKV